MAETVATIFEKWDRFRDIGQPGSAWIFTIAARQLSHHRRRSTVESTATSGSDGRSRPSTWSRLPAAEREAIQLKVIDELGYSERPQHVSGVRGWPRFRRRISVLTAGGVTVVAAAIAAVVIVLGAGGTDPASAYAVTLNNNTVTIQWNEWGAIGALNTRLTSLHMRIRIVPIVHGCVAPVHFVVYAHSRVPTHVAPGPAKTLEVDHVNQSSQASTDGGSGLGGALTTWNDTLPGRTRIFTATRSVGWDPSGVWGGCCAWCPFRRTRSSYGC